MAITAIQKESKERERIEWENIYKKEKKIKKEDKHINIHLF